MTVSIQASLPELSHAIREAGGTTGVLKITNLPIAPLDAIASLLDMLAAEPGLGERANAAYPSNLVYKDAFQSHPTTNVDQKRVLDLSPERLESIRVKDPQLFAAFVHAQPAVLNFWNVLTETYARRLSRALAQAIGGDESVQREMLVDVHFNYRMVDYYTRPRNLGKMPPRCGEHRDFGTFTLIFAGEPGLEIFDDKSACWTAIPPVQPGEALMLFGWCTQIRFNGRIRAALHRVVPQCTDSMALEDPRRVSAVLFCAPKHANTVLEPVVSHASGETAQYISGIKVGQLRGEMGRKWRHREGTLNAQDVILEEKEILVERVRNQDDVVGRYYLRSLWPLGEQSEFNEKGTIGAYSILYPHHT